MSLSYQVPTEVTVDLREDDVDLSGVYGPGVVELPEPVARLLVAQELAQPAPAKKPATPKSEEN